LVEVVYERGSGHSLSFSLDACADPVELASLLNSGDEWVCDVMDYGVKCTSLENRERRLYIYTDCEPAPGGAEAVLRQLVERGIPY